MVCMVEGGSVRCVKYDNQVHMWISVNDAKSYELRK
jgi:hypothetical protein